jgi:lysophospholipase L1-like esterase
MAVAGGRLFTWQVPAQFGVERDEVGRLREVTPSEVRRGPWHVRLRVADAVCAGAVRLTWTVSSGDVEKSGACAYVAWFAREGAYEIRLAVRTAIGVQTDTQTVLVEDRLIVALGDSIAAGEGVPDIPSLTRARWRSERCHRSARAGTALAAAQIERDDAQSSVTFVHLACSGADIRLGVLGSYAGAVPPASERDLRPQVDELNAIARRRVPDAVLLSVGANDVRLPYLFAFCALRTKCAQRPIGGSARRKPTMSAYVKPRLGRLPRDFAALDAAISKRVPRDRITIVDYFDPTRDRAGTTCPRILGGLTRPELKHIQGQVLEPLNRAIAAAATRHGWRLIRGNMARFRTHGYCAGRQSWITSLSQSVLDLGGPLDGRLLGTLHPNATGQEAIGRAIAAQLERRFFPGQAFAPLHTPRVRSGSDLLAGISAVVLGALALGVAAGAQSRRAPLLPRRRSDVVLAIVGIAVIGAAMLSAAFLVALALGIAAGSISRRGGVVERPAAAVALAVVGVAVILVAVLVRDVLSGAAGLRALGGAAVAFGILTSLGARSPAACGPPASVDAR